jgi:hypothetical protein
MGRISLQYESCSRRWDQTAKRNTKTFRVYKLDWQRSSWRRNIQNCIVKWFIKEERSWFLYNEAFWNLEVTAWAKTYHCRYGDKV